MFRNMGPSAIDKMLERIEKEKHYKAARAAAAGTKEGETVEELPEPPPSLTDFLDDEDLLPECRSDNELLLTYLSQEHVLHELLRISIVPWNRTSKLAAAIADDSSEGERMREELSSMTLDNNAQGDVEMEAKRQFKWPYVASEVLASEVERITRAFMKSSACMDMLMSYLDAPPGSLDRIGSIHFSKIFCALLRTQHIEMLQDVAKRDGFIEKLVSHVSNSAIADILVRLMDGEETEEYSALGNPPAAPAIALMTDHAVCAGLGELYYKAALGQLELPVHPEFLQQEGQVAAHTDESQDKQQSSSSGGGVDFHHEDDETRMHRYREETMESCISTLLGITLKVLRMPVMKLEVPQKINIYGCPEVVCRMLDGGIECMKGQEPCPELALALKFVTDLMTTDANLTPEEPDSEQNALNAFILGMSPPGRRTFLSGQLSSGHKASNSRAAAQLSPYRETEQKDGPRTQIMNTRLLEEHCVSRFDRLRAILQQNGATSLVNTSGNVNLLGSTRLRLVEFFVAFLKRGNDKTLQSLVEKGVPRLLLEMCVEHVWSSMLHGIVASAAVAALSSGSSSDTINRTWLSADLVGMVMKLWERNEEVESTGFHFRTGFMGSVIMIAKELDAYMNRLDEAELRQWVSEEQHAAFRSKVADQLGGILVQQNTALGGGPPNSTRAVSDDEGTYEEATEVFDMDEVIDGLSTGNKDVISRFANYLFARGGPTGEFDDDEGVEDDLEDDDEDAEVLDVSDFNDVADDEGGFGREDSATSGDYEQFVFVPSPKVASAAAYASGPGQAPGRVREEASDSRRARSATGDSDPAPVVGGSAIEGSGHIGDTEEEDDENEDEGEWIAFEPPEISSGAAAAGAPAPSECEEVGHSELQPGNVSADADADASCQDFPEELD
ncbi:Serine/threonine-protein phosphatase 6 regulatory subunit 1 [Porphyridium purpureum]|uniref:Serine/threonine-protein phosphatase 6 regulatory subunit 1 n=1 Tax=Porphyridium purpureum TaxID=35688 RepID=A0A5J4Z6K7_PORPP|nr:Serine/threonine-protein phosphatase 6 regulatory subunit 1 [Porphyridium purpureum]|eukprot:POR1607..scf295_1